MRKLLLASILLLNAQLSVFSQEMTDSVPTDSTQTQQLTKTVFAELLGWNTNVLGLGKRAKVEVDFGDESWGWTGNDGRDLLVDESGKEIKFNSMVDAMNYMGERGWVYEDSYVVTVANQNVIHWLLSKEIPIDGNAREGITQRRDLKKNKKKNQRKSERDPIYD